MLLKLCLDDLLKAVNRFFESLDSTASRVQEIGQETSEIIEILVQSVREVAREALVDGGEEPAAGGGEQISRLSVDASGEIVETTLNESGPVVEESIKGNSQDLPVEEELFDSENRLVSRRRDDSGDLFEGRVDEEGNLVYVGLVPETRG